MKAHHLFFFLPFCFAACSHSSENKEEKKLRSIYQQQADSFAKANQRKMQFLEMAKAGKLAIQGKFTAVDGTLLPSDSLTGKLVIMDFWATWCGPCLEQIPHFYEMASHYDSSVTAFLLVSVDTEMPHWKRFVEKKHWTKNSYWIGDESANNPLIGYAFSKMGEGDTAYAVLGLPKVVVIGKDGKIKAHYDGKIEGAKLGN